jgi:hypothetical protein
VVSPKTQVVGVAEDLALVGGELVGGSDLAKVGDDVEGDVRGRRPRGVKNSSAVARNCRPRGPPSPFPRDPMRRFCGWPLECAPEGKGLRGEGVWRRIWIGPEGKGLRGEGRWRRIWIANAGVRAALGGIKGSAPEAARVSFLGAFRCVRSELVDDPDGPCGSIRGKWRPAF